MRTHHDTARQHAPQLAGWWLLVACCAVIFLVASGDDDDDGGGGAAPTPQPEDTDDPNVGTGGCTGCLEDIWTEVFVVSTPEELTEITDAILLNVAANADPADLDELGVRDLLPPGQEPDPGNYTLEELKAFVVLANSYRGELDADEAIAELEQLEADVNPEVAGFIERARVDLPVLDLANDPGRLEGATGLLESIENLPDDAPLSPDEVETYQLLVEYSDALAANDDAAATALADRLNSQLETAEIEPIVELFISEAISERPGG